MNDLKDQFLQRSISGLRDLASRIDTVAPLEGPLSAEAFRLLHTIKGTAQTFGLAAAAKLAHGLENRLSPPGTATGDVLSEGISHLIDLLEKKESSASAAFSQKLETEKARKGGGVFISRIPRVIFARFSDTEKDRLFAAYKNGREIFCFAAAFDLADFTADFKSLREKLDQVCETIATFPGSSEAGKIEFIIFVAAADAEGIARTAAVGTHLEAFGVARGSGLVKALSQVADHGVQLAAELGKEVNIIICVEYDQAGQDAVDTIFDILLHLVRNAVDHAFSSKGNIFITLGIKGSGLLLTIQDNGAGLDPDLIRSKAVEKGMIGPDDRLEPSKLLDLIFSPGFSTAGAVTEISGRGVGLDAVKCLVEDSGGTIRFDSAKGEGTAFLVFLPIL